MDEFYNILNVNPNSSFEEIKLSYKRLAKKYHPDRGGSTQKFQTLHNAFLKLSDYHEKSKHTPSSNVFQKKTNNIYFLHISLEDIFRGKNTTININRSICCSLCMGIGCMSLVPCTSCNGLGNIRRTLKLGIGLVQQIISMCEDCQGSGKMKVNICNYCNGTGFTSENLDVDIKISPGTLNNERIILENLGDFNLKTSSFDSLTLMLKEKPHRRFSRNGYNLFLEQNISVGDALCGFSFNFVHLNGSNYHVVSEEIIDGNKYGIIKNLGMPLKNSNNFGDLFIKFIINFPPKLINHNDITSILPEVKELVGQRVFMEF